VRRTVAAIALGLVLALAPGAAAQDSPFGPGPSSGAPAQTTPATTAPASSSSSSGGGLSGGAKLALILGGAVLLGVTAVAIVRDARRSAPGRRGAATRPAPAPRPDSPGARGRPTGKGSSARRRRRKR